MPVTADLINRSVNTLRFLSADGVQKANSGHPGLPMGCAAIAYTLWMRHMKHNPSDPKWINRDRFILSGGHGSMLLYSLLHLTGYDLSLEQLKSFRQWGSLTPGHPEYGLTPGVETTTGPLGQGFANGVGMAIAQAELAILYNRPSFDVFSHFTYAIVTDGDLMEGITSEAASLAGHLRVGNLVYLYDDNRITIEGSTELTFSEDRAKRFEAYGWQVLHVEDGNDVDAIDNAIGEARADPRPSLIICKTHIGFGLPTKQDTSKAHGEPPGKEELDAAKKALDWPLEPDFYIPEDVATHFKTAAVIGNALESKWQKLVKAYTSTYPELGSEIERRFGGRLPSDWESAITTFPKDPKGIATRAASKKVINDLAKKVPELIGGSADLAPSTLTWIENSASFQVITRGGRNFHFGVREHAMGAIVNGITLHGGFIPFGSTFLVFSDYMRPTLRISALSKIPSIWVFTHDSIGLGEDGPTHQPVEHLAALRAIPGLVVIRPGDANETAAAWKVAISRRNGPTLLALSRQAMPTLDREIFAPASELDHGAYVLADLGEGDIQIILMATGSEVSLIIDAGLRLAAEGYSVRLVSFPSWELFNEQSEEYKKKVLPPSIKSRLAVEAGVSQGWERWVGDHGKIISIDHFGASAPAKVLFEQFGFTPENVIETAMEVIRENNPWRG
jgi:transketolase